MSFPWLIWFHDTQKSWLLATHGAYCVVWLNRSVEMFGKTFCSFCRFGMGRFWIETGLCSLLALNHNAISMQRNNTTKCYRIIEYRIIYHAECAFFSLFFTLIWLKQANGAHNFWLYKHIWVQIANASVTSADLSSLIEMSTHTYTRSEWKIEKKN